MTKSKAAGGRVDGGEEDKNKLAFPATS